MNLEGIRAGESVGATDRPKDMKEAAAAFEALLLSQLMKLARNESNGENGTMLEFAEEHLAGEIAKSGGLGFARLIESQTLTSK